MKRMRTNCAKCCVPLASAGGGEPCISRCKMASRAAAAASPLLLLLCLGSTVGEYSSQSVSTFVDTLLAEYDRAVAPSERTRVTLTLDVRHAAVDDRAATMRLLADLTMSWEEPRLSWNGSLWEGDSVLVAAERLWAPDVALVSAGGGGAGGAVLRARLAARGAVAAVQRLDLAAPLALQLAAWPRDTQEAVFKFASRTLNTDEIDITIGDDANSLVVESGAWEVVSVVGEQESRAGAAWRVRAARRSAAQAAAGGAALAAALLLLLAAAALPYHERAPLAACAAFLAATWLSAASSQVPASSSTPAAVAVWGGACAAAAALGACAAATTRLARRAAAPPAALRALLSRLPAAYTLATDPVTEGSGGAWAAAARLLDAAVVSAALLAVAVLAAVYIFS